MAEMGHNELQVTGDAVVLHRFRQQADERFVPLAVRDPYNGSNPSVLSFHRLVPVPASVAARDYGAPGGGCAWQKTHWGVKWGASGAKLHQEPEALTYSFETAWRPPLAFLQAVSADYPALMFTLAFSQPISRFPEQFAFQNGETRETDEYGTNV